MCSICFYPFEKNDKQYKCIRHECNDVICEECLISLIIFSEKNKLIPKCPSNGCNGIFTLSHIRGIPKIYIRSYASACFRHVMKDKGDMVKKRIQEAQIISNIRDERLAYLEKEYPKAISLVATLVFQNKLRALDKQKSKIVKAQVNKSNRTCMNTTCNGFLDPNFVCMTCETEFCNKCEKKITPEHECQQEDLDSVNIINNMIKCPGCKLPVFKNEGCDSITCANCSTNFQYSTGKTGGHGSVNAKLQKVISLDKKEKLSNILVTEINSQKNFDVGCLQLLLKLEALEPQIKTKEIILSPLKAYFKHSDEDKAGMRIAQKIDEYYNSSVKYKQFQIIITKFEEKVNNNNNTESLKTYLKDAIKELRG